MSGHWDLRMNPWGRKTPTVRRTYKYRIYPTKAQAVALEDQLAFCCDLYNAALEQRRDAWRRGRSIRPYDQMRELTELRASGSYPERMACDVQRDPLRRLDRAFQAFFRRCKAGETPGYPRFRSRLRYDSLTWPAGSGASPRDSRLCLKGIGSVNVRWHREIPANATIKTITVKRSAGRWYACFSLEVPLPKPLPASDEAVGVDLGVTTFAALSTGELIEGPRAYRKAQRELRVAQRRVARRRRGSNRRRKAILILAQKHERMRNVRRDHAHKAARDLVRRFGVVAVEDLRVANMTRSAKGTLENPGRRVRQKSGLNREIQDQGWGQFLTLLSEKAEEAARTVVRVDPRRTSQTCSACGHASPESRFGGRFRCVACAYVANADVNAAKNILARAGELRPGRGRQALTRDEEVCVV